MRVSDEQLGKIIEAYRKAGSITATALLLNMPRTTVSDQLRMASDRGMFNVPGGGLPPGQILKGASILYGPDGDIKAQWVKTKQDNSYPDILSALQQEFDGYTGGAKVRPAPKATDKELATFYIVSDHHLGLYSWAAETGEDYDVDIGKGLLLDAMTSLVSQTPNSDTAVVLNLGDFFHSDSDDNRTRRSGNSLDVDTRYARVLQVGVALMIAVIDMAKQKHRKVIVRNLQGNHDPYAALALSVALAAFYAKDDRVEVVTDPSYFFWWTFGKVFIGSTHGDMIRHNDMPSVMAAYKPKEWGESEFRYIYLGHVHHKGIGGGESAGVTWETFRTLAAKDAWHRQSGYNSARSMVAITHHKDYGEVMRHTVSVKGPNW